MISITLHWWYLPLILFIIPIIYITFSKDPGGYFGIDFIRPIVLGICWSIALGILIGHFF